ncbi:S-adenosylmethionine decarboxylase proenzyme [Bacilli bacterium]|nr:S-adenosylmethionine decarboxylase proenzyme [Bacilli bacterium]
MLIKKRIKLHEFNNLSKSLRFSFYDISYAESTEDKQGYNNYIHKTFSAEKLTEVLRTITQKIGAHILNLSCQDYEPVGASVCVLITEEPVNPEIVNPTNNLGKIEEIYAHLDKSHIAVHTYPEYSPKNNVASFRVDVEVSTCGKISPINCLNYLLEVFDSNVITDIVEIDYTIRGFTRSQSDKKIFIDHQINSITDFIKPKYIERYSIRNLDNPVERT